MLLFSIKDSYYIQNTKASMLIAYRMTSVSAETTQLLVSECILFEMGSSCFVLLHKALGRDFAQATGYMIDILLSTNNDPGHKDHFLYFGKADLSNNCLTTMYA